GWRLPTSYELWAAYGNRISGAAKEGWLTAADMSRYYWASNLNTNYTPTAGNTTRLDIGHELPTVLTHDAVAVVCVHL
ncbi:MAG: hypothetical protein EBU49_10085, partial [Proteobacteria bacterium]|nr:hypothetical protein [Pseudomonadota bacterium]